MRAARQDFLKIPQQCFQMEPGEVPVQMEPGEGLSFSELHTKLM